MNNQKVIYRGEVYIQMKKMDKLIQAAAVVVILMNNFLLKYRILLKRNKNFIITLIKEKINCYRLLCFSLEILFFLEKFKFIYWKICNS